MGASASLQNDVLANRKLRKLILLRAYNKRASDMSVQDQFRKYVQVDENGHRFVETEDCMRELGIGDKKLTELTKRFGVQLNGRLEYEEFLTFLENGGDKCKTPVRKPRAPRRGDVRSESPSPQTSGNQEQSPDPAERTPSLPQPARATPLPTPPIQTPAPQASPPPSPPAPHLDAPMPPAPPGMPSAPAPEPTSYTAMPKDDGPPSMPPPQQGVPEPAPDADAEQPEELNVEPIITEPETPRDAPTQKTGAAGEEPTKKVVRGLANPDDGAVIEYNENTTWLPKHKSLWKKREVVINEKITEYTKVDDEGVMQMLVESEKSQTEVLHMESKDGEFAHRETTEFEQFEKFNEELVMHQTGTERFVHLKSHEDEFSHFESSMPTGEENQEGGGMPPPPTAHSEHPSVADDPSKPEACLDAFKAPFHNVLFFLEERDMIASTIACHRWRISIYEFVQFIQEAQQEAQLTDGIPPEEIERVDQQVHAMASEHGWTEEQMVEQRLVMLAQMQEDMVLQRLPPEAVQELEERLAQAAEAEGWPPEQFMMMRRQELMQMDQEMQVQMQMMMLEQQAMSELSPEIMARTEEELQQTAMEEGWSQEQYMQMRAERLSEMLQEQGI